ncbi:uncharacterized protein METZ01_LOCUS295536 [marine metagenome]|uniref:Uncharacterized protein n=1 Tax=marine metagenome TaxID=408172 RepID=A0A382M5Q1_9ZZZZ
MSRIGPRGGVICRFKPPGREEGMAVLCFHFAKKKAQDGRAGVPLWQTI